jgi:hypothetical protein
MNFKDYIAEKTGDKEAYQKFFDKMLKKWDIESPEELSDEDKKKFYEEVDAGWKSDDEEAGLDEAISLRLKIGKDEGIVISKEKTGASLKIDIKGNTSVIDLNSVHISKLAAYLMQLQEDVITEA